MKLKYIGPHEAVTVPHDLVAGGELVVAHGEVVEVPDELAAGLLEQGQDSADPARHQPQWAKATRKEADAADSDPAKDGDR